MSTPALRTVGLTIRYGGVVANSDVNIEVRPGEVVGLIGPNGAGKTSFVDAVTGFTRATGEVWVGDSRVDAMSPHRRRKAGLARTWQAGELFNQLSVLDNVMAATQQGGLAALWSDIIHPRRRAVVAARATAVLERSGLQSIKHRLPTELSLGQQKLVGVARAIAGTASIVLLDEPAAGLDSRESLKFGVELREMVRDSLGVLLIDHDMDLVMSACDRVYVLDFGQLIASGPPSQVRADPAVIKAYLGSVEQPA